MGENNTHTALKGCGVKKTENGTFQNSGFLYPEYSPGAVFTNIPNLSLILVIKFMTFVLVKIGPNLVFTKHVLARTIFLILY